MAESLFRAERATALPLYEQDAIVIAQYERLGRAALTASFDPVADTERRYRRFENPKAVEIQIDADGKPTVTVFPREGKAVILVMTPRFDTRFVEDRSHDNPIFTTSGTRE